MLEQTNKNEKIKVYIWHQQQKKKRNENENLNILMVYDGLFYDETLQMFSIYDNIL